MRKYEIIKKASGIGNAIFSLIAGVSAFLSVVIYYLAQWIIDTWGLLTMDEIIFHLKVPLDGTSEDMVRDAVNNCLPAAFMGLIVIVVLLVVLRKRFLTQLILKTIIIICSAVLMFNSVKYLWSELSISEYIENQRNQSSFIQDNYIDPRSVDIIFPEQKRNLIYIYLESMETTFASKDVGGGMEFNAIPELTQLADENISFSNSNGLGGAYAATGATWTMGAMFAQTSGLPLSIPIDGNAMDKQEEFLPEIESLGDILDRQGYQQVLMIGSDATFGGRKKYFEQHGNYEMCDYYDAIEKGLITSDYRVAWGYEDEKLFEISKEKLLDLSSSDKPFNFTMLTVDTHFPDGYICPLCREDYPSGYANVIACSSRQVLDFVNWIKEQPFYSNTTIVISGDHLTMQPNESTFFDTVDEKYDRRVYNVFLNTSVSAAKTKEREFNTMDMFPSTLASMGVIIEKDKLGLGTNLFSEVMTLSEQYGKEKVNEELDRKSVFFENFTKGIEE